MTQTPTIDRLLNLVPDSPSTVLDLLRAHPELASRKDAHGYSLVHAATSYGQVQLLQALIRDYNVDPNITDEDSETALFNVEDVDMAKLLLDLGTDSTLRNDDGQTAAEKLDDEDEQPAVAAFLREVLSPSASANGVAAPTAVTATTSSQTEGSSSRDDTLRSPPPPLPAGVQINVGTMAPTDAGDAPDPEFRRRIEELAAREDFESEESQRELRNLVSDALSGLAPGEGQGPASRRRLG